MRKRWLVKVLCIAMSTSMVAEVGATAFTDQSAAVFEDVSVFTDTAVESEAEVTEEIPVVEDVSAMEEVPSTEEVPVVEEVPPVEDVPVVEEVPPVEDVPAEEEVPSVEEVPAVEEVPPVEDAPPVEDNPIEEIVPPTDEDAIVEEIPGEEEIPVEDLFTSEVVEDEEVFLSVEIDATDLVNQEGNIYEVADWEVDEKGWKLAKNLEIPDEAPVEGGAVEIPQPYFTLEDGIVRILTRENETASAVVSDGYYLFNADGYLVTGQYMMQPGTKGYIYEAANEYLYMPSEYAALNVGVAEGTAKTPYNSNLGQLQRNYWFWNGTSFRFYDNSGKYQSVAELKASALAAGTFKGYFEINGANYVLGSDGVPEIGSYKITEGSEKGYYYFTSKKDVNGSYGKMVLNSWVATQKKTRWRYYGSDGRRTNFTSMVTDLEGALGNYQYLINKSGYLVKSGPAKVNGIYYYGDKRGRIVKEKLITYKGKRYYFTADGTRSTYKNQWARVACARNRWYYFGSAAGRISEKKGFQRIEGDWYYFSKAGNMYISKWTSSGRYFGADGKLYSGIQEVDGKKYYFTVSTATSAKGKILKNQMIKSGDTYYYADAKGVLLENGWVKNNGYYYYFANYKRQVDTFAKMNGVNGYLDSQGRYTTGWIITNNSQNLVKYVNPTGNDFYKNTTAWINGLQYRFDANGYRVNDRSKEISGPYYVDADITNCVMTIYNRDKTIPVKSIRISPGAAGTPTPTGPFYLKRLGRWWTLMGPSYGQYCTHVVGAGRGGIIIHSVPTVSPNVYSFSPREYNKLGQPASHGCIRVCVADSKWVYDNCQGASIRIFRGTYNANEVFKGPLGRRAIVPIVSNSYDPTDPAIVGNKYY